MIRPPPTPCSRGGSADVFDAQALWWRGEVPPELAWTVAVELHNPYADRRVAAVQVALDSVVATVALAAGQCRRRTPVRRPGDRRRRRGR